MAENKTQTNQDDGFTTVSEGNAEPETKIVFDTLGESFTGIYLGMRTIPGNDSGGSYEQARFEGYNSGDNGDGETYFLNANYSLRNGLKGVRNGTLTRITWTDELDTGQEKKMRIFRVETNSKKKVSRKS